MIKTLALFMFFAMSTLAGDRWTKAMAYGSCVASAADFASSMSSKTLLEANPILRGANGRPSPWKLGIFKGATCAGVVYLAYKRHDHLVPMEISVTQTAVFTLAVVHNIKLERKQ